ncbi:MAG: FIG01123682: hypothetical protein, partial [uncultured Acidimicrobiales bacterium]
GRGVRRSRLVVPGAGGRHRVGGAVAPRPRDPRGHPPDFGHGLRRASDAAGVRLRHPRPRVRPGRRLDGWSSRVRGPGVPQPVGAAHRARRRGRPLRRPRPVDHVHRHHLPRERHQRPAQPGVPLLHHPQRGV